MRKPYLLRVPDFDPVSGGIRVMYGLYGWLLSKGEIAYLNTIMDVPAVGIYPEIYSGNDMQASKVARYILQTPGLMGTTGNDGVFHMGPKEDEIKATSDYIYVFSQIYNTMGVDKNHILFLPILNLKLFTDQRKRRTRTCYLVGKGVDQQKHPAGSIEITRTFAVDQQALADLFNECHTFYCYDRLSAAMEIARLCGCGVYYYGDFSKKELAKYEPGMNGISYRGEDISHFNPGAFRSHYEGLVKTFSAQLDLFIEETQQ